MLECELIGHILKIYFDVFSLCCSRSSVALQIWQPQAVRSQHHEVLQQESVNVGARQRSLQMEINVCRERVQQFEKSLVNTVDNKHLC